MDEKPYEFQKPVKQGDVLEVKIEDFSERGDGIAKVQGFVVFVPGTQKGEEVKIKVLEVRRKFALAQIV